MAALVPGRLFMRPMDLDDVDTVAGWLGDMDDLSLFDRRRALPLGKDALRDAWKADLSAADVPTAYWFILEADDREPVALAGLHSISHIHGDSVLAILVSRQARERGLGLRIAIAALDMAFDRLRLHRVTTFFRSDNLRSERLTRRTGFQQEGRMREAWFGTGQFFDCIVVGLLREEWYARRTALLAELDGSIEIVPGPTAAGPTACADGSETPEPSQADDHAP